MILVIANYRTGSTTLVNQLCEQTGYQKSSHGGEMFFNKQPEHPPGSDWVIKVMPDQIKNHKGFEQNYLAVAERIIYSARQDFGAQICSYELAFKSGWHPAEIESHGAIKNIKGIHEIDFTKCNRHQNKLLNNLKNQITLYKQHGGEWKWLEEREQKPYRSNTVTYLNTDKCKINPVEMLSAVN